MTHEHSLCILCSALQMVCWFYVKQFRRPTPQKISTCNRPVSIRTRDRLNSKQSPKDSVRRGLIMHLPWTSAAPVRGGKMLESQRSGGLPYAFSSRAVVRALPSSHGHGSAHHPRRHAAGFPARYQSYTSSPSHHSLDMIGAEKNIFDISSMPTFALCSPETDEAM